MDVEVLNKSKKINVITGGPYPDEYLYNQIQLAIEEAQEIDIIVSFVMVSGVRMIIDDLKRALDRGVKIRILTGNYLGITQPWALYLIKEELGDRVELKFYNDARRSFHAKSYIFSYQNDGDVFVGSSNISRSALTSGIEWNYRVNMRQDRESYKAFRETFNDLFEHHSLFITDDILAEYSKTWRKPFAHRYMYQYDEKSSQIESVKPRDVQIEALYALKKCRSEGKRKALIFAAPGIGKTYLAAFDAKAFGAKKVLFVVHREEILMQAKKSFEKVFNSNDTGIFKAEERNLDARMIFASVSTLAKEENLCSFDREAFDYMIVDEFHHAASDQYLKILEYFKPHFMLGLTATPDRMDGKNVYELCDNNIAYKINLKDAINRGILSPFRYYGICDVTVDYSMVKEENNRYNVEDLTEKYISNASRYDLIYKHYKKYHSQRTIGFCVSRKHAEAMAKEFNDRDIASAAVYSGNGEGAYQVERSTALERFKQGAYKILFVVDMFNEGVDVPDIDMVMFLRPTESSIVFLQQLGRGLRKSAHKDFLTVLDFIGNYKKAYMAPKLLSASEQGSNREGGIMPEFEYPDDCIVDFDLELIDLFREMEFKRKFKNAKIGMQFADICNKLGRVPSRVEWYEETGISINELCKQCRTSHGEEMIQTYLDFLQYNNFLNPDQIEMCASVAGEFLRVIETTRMSKSYKMVLLLAFFNNGNIRSEITEAEALKVWKDFYAKDSNWLDRLGQKDEKNIENYFKISDKKHLADIYAGPVNHLEEAFFEKKKGYALTLNENLEKYLKNDYFVKQFQDIVDYRVREYYRKKYSVTAKVTLEKH